MIVNRWDVRNLSRKKLVLLAVSGIALVGLLASGAYAALGGTVLSQTAGDIELQRGLIGHWKLDGNVKDSTPYANDATASTGTVTSDRKNKASSAYMTDGISQYASVPDSTSLSSGSTSVSLWVTVNANIDCDANNNWRSLIRKGSTASTSTGWDIVLEQSGDISWDVGLGGVTSRRSADTNLSQGVTKLLTVTYDASTGDQVIYTNGSLTISKTNTPTSIGANTLPIDIARGSNAVACPNGGGYAPVTYDDVRIYNRALNANEAMALYDQYDAEIRAGSGQGGLVGHWKMDGNAKDSTPNRNHGTVNGATLTADRKGAASRAYSFPGSGANNIDLGNSTAFNASEVTMAAWIRPDTISGSVRTIMAKENQYKYRLNVNGGVEVLASADGSTWSMTGFNLTPANSVTIGNWYHVATTISSTANTVKVYINGVEAASVALGTPISGYNTQSLFIGSRYSGGSEPFAGTIDDARFYNRSLAADEIKQLADSYDSQINLNSSPSATLSGGNINQGLTGYWPFSGNAKDSTPYRNHGVVSGATLTVDRKGRADSAYAFDGTSSSISVPSSPEFRFDTGNFAYSLFFYVTASSASNQQLLSTRSGTGAGYELQVNPSGSVEAILGPNRFYSAGSISNGTWNHAVFSRDGTAVSLYINGVLSVTGSDSTDNNSTANLRIGVDAVGDYLNGAVDDVRTYNRALSPTEVQTLYASQ